MAKILTLVAVALLAVSCGAYSAVVSFFESSDAAAKATEETAIQLTDTLHSLEHALWLIPAYLMGEARKPLWGKWKKHKKRKKKRG